MSNWPKFDCYGYLIERELGSNRTGGRVTYLARDMNTQQQVVIKQFQFAKTSSTWSDYNAYHREIEVLQGLKHRGIPCYLNAFQTEDGFCMVQEYKNASTIAASRSFNPNEIKQIAVSLLEILVYLQHRIPPVIHRDIKPENILVDEQMNVYLVDFGFARIGNGEVGVSSVVKGTLGFMPPEQLFNRQLTEASDLYGLGMTLICLLTRTKSVDIGNLVDITYRINFKHLLPKLNFHWVKWLEKMVEPKLQERFPHAEAALEAIPASPMRLPKANFSQTSLEFTAIQLGEKLTQAIAIHNRVPETMLSGIWEVAPHPQDPPHTPDYHDWISLEPATFAANQTECHITVNTSKLMAGQTYTRKILLHSNTLPETHTLTLQVQTAPMPIRTEKLPVGILALQGIFSLVVAGIVSWSVSTSATFVEAPVAASIGGIAGAAVGWEAAAWLMATAGAITGAKAGFFAGVVAGIVASMMVLTGSVVTGGTTALTGALGGLIGGVIIGVATGIAVEKLMARGWDEGFTIWLSLLSAAVGSTLGIGLVAGFLNSLVIGAVVGTGLPWVAMMIHLNLRRTRLIAEYRRSERYLIKP
ncbi:MAG: serine/threonine protein kinase [Symploca sp. SIO3E6]|nr:serine/threonine protein kinase [Caldora sp. SIO3E6]